MTAFFDRFSRLTLARRIFSTGALLFVILLLVAGNAVLSLGRVSEDLREMRDHAMPNIALIGQADKFFMRCYSRLLIAKDAPTPEERTRKLAEADAYLVNAKQALMDYEKNVLSEEDRQYHQALMKQLGAYVEKRVVYTGLLRDGKIDEAVVFVSQQLDPANVSLRESLDKLLDWNLSRGKLFAEESASRADGSVRLDVEFMLGGALLFVIVGFFTVRSINRALNRVTDSIKTTSDSLLHSASQVSSSSHSLAEGSSSQAASIEEISSSIEELSSMTKRNAESALAGKKAANEARLAAEEGAAEMQQMQTAMGAIQNSSMEISKIIKTIDEIAFQTNILALNAAVEAARAGEAGAGFAVVAEEVRSLAQRSAVAAKETADKVADAGVRSTQGVEYSTRAAESLKLILERNKEVDMLVSEVATASGEQRDGIEQINHAITQMDRVTQSNAAGAEETAAAAQELKTRSMELRTSSEKLAALVGAKAEPETNESEEIRTSGTPSETARCIPRGGVCAPTKKRDAQRLSAVR